MFFLTDFPVSKQENKETQCLLSEFFLYKKEGNKTLSGQFQDKILSRNKECMLSGADLTTQKKIQVGEKCLPRFQTHMFRVFANKMLICFWRALT